MNSSLQVEYQQKNKNGVGERAVCGFKTTNCACLQFRNELGAATAAKQFSRPNLN